MTTITIDKNNYLTYDEIKMVNKAISTGEPIVFSTEEESKCFYDKLVKILKDGN